MADPRAAESGLPPAVKTAAEKAAKDGTRSLSSLLEKLLTEHLKAKGLLK